VDQRGRGRSDYDTEASNYRPDVYCADMFTLVDHLGLERPIAIGTSMGGIMIMLMSALRPGVFKAAILNDIGPEIDPKGLERIKNYVGEARPFPNWQAATMAVRKIGAIAFPEYSDNDWIAFAKRTCEQRDDGLIHFSYDPAISAPIKDEPEAAAPADMWPLFATLGDVPILIVRGGTSDILSVETLEKMGAQHPNCQKVTVPGIGHAPMLDEPEARKAIETFLSTIQ
ncbi:MAG: alpha/beta hydrolase, partial [Acidimicrobiales bacterium]